MLMLAIEITQSHMLVSLSVTGRRPHESGPSPRELRSLAGDRGRIVAAEVTFL